MAGAACALREEAHVGPPAGSDGVSSSPTLTAPAPLRPPASALAAALVLLDVGDAKSAPTWRMMCVPSARTMCAS